MNRLKEVFELWIEAEIAKQNALMAKERYLCARQGNDLAASPCYIAFDAYIRLDIALENVDSEDISQTLDNLLHEKDGSTIYYQTINNARSIWNALKQEDEYEKSN